MGETVRRRLKNRITFREERAFCNVWVKCGHTSHAWWFYLSLDYIKCTQGWIIYEVLRYISMLCVVVLFHSGDSLRKLAWSNRRKTNMEAVEILIGCCRCSSGDGLTSNSKYQTRLTFTVWSLGGSSTLGSNKITVLTPHSRGLFGQIILKCHRTRLHIMKWVSALYICAI